MSIHEISRNVLRNGIGRLARFTEERVRRRQHARTLREIEKLPREIRKDIGYLNF